MFCQKNNKKCVTCQRAHTRWADKRSLRRGHWHGENVKWGWLGESVKKGYSSARDSEEYKARYSTETKKRWMVRDGMIYHVPVLDKRAIKARILVCFVSGFGASLQACNLAKTHCKNLHVSMRWNLANRSQEKRRAKCGLASWICISFFTDIREKTDEALKDSSIQLNNRCLLFWSERQIVFHDLSDNMESLHQLRIFS